MTTKSWLVSYQTVGNNDGDWDTYVHEGEKPPTREEVEKMLENELCGFKVDPYEKLNDEEWKAMKAQMDRLRAEEDALFHVPPSVSDKDGFYPEDEEFREVDPPPSYFKDQELYYVKKDLAKCKEFLEKYLNESRKPSDESNDEFLSRLLEEMDSLHRELCPGEYANGDD